MESVADSLKTILNISNNSDSSPKKTAKASKSTDDFEKLLRANLTPDKSDNVSEEELFASLISQRLTSMKGEDVAKKFNDELKVQAEKIKRPDGVFSKEEAANHALQKLVTDSVLTAEEGDKVYSECFAGAQLDSNTDKLFDDRGGANDPTIAVENIETALMKLRIAMDSIDSGETKVSGKKLSEALSPSGAGVVNSLLGTSGSVSPKGTTIDGNGGFLFKPEAGDGRLAILSLGGNLIDSISLKDKNRNVIEKGHFTSFGDNPAEGRAKYSFSKPGGSYPDNITVEVAFQDGTTKLYEIPDPAKRYD